MTFPTGRSDTSLGGIQVSEISLERDSRVNCVIAHLPPRNVPSKNVSSTLAIRPSAAPAPRQKMSADVGSSFILGVAFDLSRTGSPYFRTLAPSKIARTARWAPCQKPALVDSPPSSAKKDRDLLAIHRIYFFIFLPL